MTQFRFPRPRAIGINININIFLPMQTRTCTHSFSHAFGIHLKLRLVYTVSCFVLFVVSFVLRTLGEKPPEPFQGSVSLEWLTQEDCFTLRQCYDIILNTKCRLTRCKRDYDVIGYHSNKRTSKMNPVASNFYCWEVICRLR